MPHYLRAFVPGATYFFTVNLEDRGSYLLVREIGRLRQAYAEVQKQHPFETLAICILPDHLHALWRLPENDHDFPKRWSLIKAGFSRGLDANPGRAVSQVEHGDKGIWQRRFWEHVVRDEKDFANHVQYIHFNPVKHGHAREVRDWPFSSFHRWVKKGMLPKEWGLARTAGTDGKFGER
jgi:putative transposase